MYIDTLRLAKQIFPELNRFKLGKIAEYLGIEVIVAHRALDDVKTLIHVFNEMLKRIEKENIHIGRIIINPKKQGMGFGKEAIRGFIDLIFKDESIKIDEIVDIMLSPKYTFVKVNKEDR